MIQVKANDNNGLSKNSALDAFQIRSVSESRFVKKIGKVFSRELTKIKDALSIVLALDQS